jgi:hypothetical protein
MSDVGSKRVSKKTRALDGGYSAGRIAVTLPRSIYSSSHNAYRISRQISRAPPFRSTTPE